MELRIFTEPQEGAAHGDLLRVARHAEATGFPAFFRSDHYMRTGTAAAHPGPSDAWVTLGALARETSRIRLGVLLSPVTFRYPGALAVTIAQVDEMSGGRVEFGIGSGWFAGEHEAIGAPFPTKGERVDRLGEQLEILTGLWGTPVGDTYSFEGKHYRIVDSPALPKPVQQPHPPIIMGGKGPRRLPRLVARYANEFNNSLWDEENTAAQFDRVRAACAEIGRDPAEITFSVAQTICVGADEAALAARAEKIGRTVEDLREKALAGSPAEVVDKLGRWRERTGLSRVYLQVLDLADLDHLDLIAAEVVPQV
ncbi:LLM class F420-dependent oxidoreductase [Amycolatopsis sp. FBCC-B4732]|uniref:LLM class F420-dependent oxidoreductase n=1 Tax=unclassified Amycolatopsis TaxID=2618356 RepID=UPI001FF5117F|nr:LLM class F420-dependent oxidoreductase [Amycolatopsis sp. FBCC-B4732]UOX89533.1 LLM class F420-dependent oxidoreductase [Amycolatopsis sp. FBCC-B4732]